jgi:hypothetical protein
MAFGFSVLALLHGFSAEPLPVLVFKLKKNFENFDKKGLKNLEK